jgi:hypothetical protein
MYIGPWQEYALYRAQNVNELKKKENLKHSSIGKANDPDHLKKEISNAIFSSLDEESAKKAMSALDAIIGNLADQVDPGHNVSVTGTVTSTSYIGLPPIATHGSRNKSNSRSHIETPKSSVSDPLPYINHYEKPSPSRFTNASLLHLPMVRQASVSDTSSRSSDYDSRSVIAMLRRERASKLIEKSSSGGNNTWQWSNSMEKPKPVVQRKLEGRLKELQKMKEMYIARGSNGNTNMKEETSSGSPSSSSASKDVPSSSSAHISATLEPIDGASASSAMVSKPAGGSDILFKASATTEAPKTIAHEKAEKKIEDLELTTTELDVISKYFDFPLSTKSSIALKSPSMLGSSPQTIVSSQDDNMKDEEDLRSNIQTPAFQAYSSTPVDDIFIGAIDGGLINWSLGLSMFDDTTM